MKVLEQLKKFSIITVVIGFISGILFISYPAECIKYISLTVGIAMIILAISAVISYFVNRNSAFSLIGGVLLGLIGIIVCVKYKQVVSLIVAIIGLFILAAGVTNLLTGFKMIKRSLFFGWFTLLMSVATIVFGFIALTNSTAVSQSLVRLIGIGLIIYAVIDLVAFFEVRSIVKEINKAAEEVAQEVQPPFEPEDDGARVTEVTDFTEILGTDETD